MSILKNLWDKKQDGNRKEERSLVRVTLVATAVLLVFLCVKRDSIFDWAKAAVTVYHQNREIAKRDAQIRELDRTLDALNNNRDSLEKFAIERFNFAAKGEDVYLVDE